MSDSFEVIRAEALFVSPLQCSEAPGPEQVRRAVVTTLRRNGIRGCAARVAGEYGEHPDLAAPRMRWALATVRAVYPHHDAPATGPARELALAS